jgi:hypothetical protein
MREVAAISGCDQGADTRRERRIVKSAASLAVALCLLTPLFSKDLSGAQAIDSWRDGGAADPEQQQVFVPVMREFLLRP